MYYTFSHGGIIRGDSTKKEIALVFTGGDYSDGGWSVRSVLKQKNIPAGFFFTGDFYRNKENKALVKQLIDDGHYLGPHSDKHLLYCSWENRDSLLVTREEFVRDMLDNYNELQRFGIAKSNARFYIPPYEWYNDTISQWSDEMGLTLVNMTPGTISHTDYTIPSMYNYRDSKTIYQSILDYEQSNPNGLNGFFLLIHIGTHPERTDKFYQYLQPLLENLIERGYHFRRIDEMLTPYGRICGKFRVKE
jgi:peptidoglycan/xylan/chitin deacetylase (PgdA/CDA1 family)